MNEQPDGMARRALLTDGEREALRDPESRENPYVAVSRVRKKINSELTTDVEVLREHHPDLFEELQEVVCEAERERQSAGGFSGREPRGSEAETGVETSDGAELTAEPAASPEQELVEHLRSWLENHPPNKSHAQEAVVETFRWLRRHGSGTTSEIQTAVYEEVNGDHYSSARTLWNSIDRYLEDVPGVEKAGYGEWKYAGDDTARQELEKQ